MAVELREDLVLVVDGAELEVTREEAEEMYEVLKRYLNKGEEMEIKWVPWYPTPYFYKTTYPPEGGEWEVTITTNAEEGNEGLRYISDMNIPNRVW